MSKPATISSLVRIAAKSEPEFQDVVVGVFNDEPVERIAEFFDRLNIPRSVEGTDLLVPLLDLSAAGGSVTNLDDEKLIHAMVQKYSERHEKKLKWHAQRPSLEGGRNVLLLMRHSLAMADVRLHRLRNLLAKQDEYTPDEWSTARDLMNGAYLSFRNMLNQLGGQWIDAMISEVDREDLEELLGNFYEFVDATIRKLEAHRVAIEERRMELTVVPREFDPVKPPNYFGGDIMGRGPWKQYWNNVEERSHHFRQALA